MARAEGPAADDVRVLEHMLPDKDVVVWAFDVRLGDGTGRHFETRDAAYEAAQRVAKARKVSVWVQRKDRPAELWSSYRPPASYRSSR